MFSCLKHLSCFGCRDTMNLKFSNFIVADGRQAFKEAMMFILLWFQSFYSSMVIMDYKLSILSSLYVAIVLMLPCFLVALVAIFPCCYSILIPMVFVILWRLTTISAQPAVCCCSYWTW